MFASFAVRKRRALVAGCFRRIFLHDNSSVQPRNRRRQQPSIDRPEENRARSGSGQRAHFVRAPGATKNRKMHNFRPNSLMVLSLRSRIQEAMDTTCSVASSTCGFSISP